MNVPLLNVVRCAAAGLAATLPMTAWMLLVQGALPPRERQLLAPEKITRNTLQAAGATTVAGTPTLRTPIATAAHFAFGTTAGAPYALLLGWKAPPVITGGAYGLLVWAANYLGLMPGLGLIGTVRERPAARNAQVIAAHLVWGVSLALLVRPRGSGHSA